MSERPSLLSARQIADRFGVAERTVRRWIAAGQLEATKERGQFRIALDDAQAAYDRSRASRASEQAEWRGRYIETKERLERVESELAAERERRLRLELVLWPPQLEQVPV